MDSNFRPTGSSYDGITATDNSRVHAGNVYNNLIATQRETSYFNTLTQAEKDQKLVEAAEDGNLRRLTLLLHAEANPDHEDLREGKDRFAALHHAVSGGYLDCIEVLLDYGADINAANEEGGITALKLAVVKGNFTVVKFLVSKRAKNTGDALFTAIELSSEDIVKYLLGAGASLDIALFEAVSERAPIDAPRIAALRRLVAMGANVNWKPEPEKATILHVALVNKQESLARFLIDIGANPNTQDKYGKTPLMVAIMEIAHPSIIDLLLKSNADVTIKTKLGWTAIHCGARWASEETFAFLLGWRGWFTENQFTTLTFARSQYLVAKNNEGETPLMIAAAYHNFQAVRQLIVHKVEVNTVDNIGRTALFLTVFVCLLGLQKNKDLMLDIVKILCEYGADPSIRTHWGNDVLAIARRENYIEVSQVLESYARKP